MNILVVDDSLVMRMIVEKGLRHAAPGHCRVTHAANGLDGLLKIERQEEQGDGFDLILTDVHMPVMSGPELIAEMRRRGLAGGAAVVLITADEEAGIMEGGQISGVNRLSKPFTLEQMKATLRPLLEEAAHG